jgi:hypothetical protein
VLASDSQLPSQIQTGTTYDAADYDGPIYIIRTVDSNDDGKGTVKRDPLYGTFTVTDIKNAQGQSVDQVDVWKPQFQTTDTTELAKQVAEYLDRQDETDTNSPTGGGGGGGGSSTTDLLLFGGVLGAAAYAYQRYIKGDGGGGRGGRRRRR